MKERIRFVAPKRDEAARRRIADHFDFNAHPLQVVEPEGLMRFDAALPSWYRAPLFDHLPPEEAQRRLTIPYRLEYPAQGERPAGFKPAASAASPAPVAPSPF